MAQLAGKQFHVFAGTLLTAIPVSLTTFPTGFSTNEITSIRDTSSNEQQTDIDFGNRADPRRKRVEKEGLTYTVTFIYDNVDADYLLFADAARAGTALALFFGDNTAAGTPNHGDLANWNIKRTTHGQELRAASIVTFECTINDFACYIKVPAA